MKAVIRQLGSLRILYDSQCLPAPEDNLLEEHYWARQDRVSGQLAGRGRVLVVDTPAGPGVLRRFLRGGLVARFNRGRYLFTGWERSRGFREWRMLERLFRAGLPVPAPLAASCERAGPWYGAGLLTRQIPRTDTLADRLQANSIGREEWLATGRVIRKFHDHGVEHADLNARNILLDPAGGVFLVDFDRGRMVRPETVWRQRMLRRLKRSLKGLAESERVEQAWRWLLAGYTD